MIKTLNILSIDFDFFQNVSKKALYRYYPEGLDLPTEISNIVWAGHYSTHNEQILNIKPYKKGLKIVKKIIKENMPYHAMIRNSHVHCYHFILDYLYDHPEIQTINLYNIDMHHDVSNQNDKLDCGNWIGKLSETLPETVKLNVIWIANRVSKYAYGLTSETERKMLHEDINILNNRQFELIFLCRSDNWVPPHLDTEFIELANIIQDTAYFTEIEEKILTPRYNETFRKNVQSMMTFTNQTKKQMHA